jgi:carboxylesterase type B
LPTNFNFPVVDGTYLTSTYINLNASAANKQSSSVVVMTGVNRDEEGILIPLIPTTNLSESILNQGDSDVTNAAIFAHIDEFPLGTGPTFNNTPVNQVFNTTVRIATDRGFRCSDEFTAIAAASTGIWPRVYFYEFNRTYQEPDYNTTGVCGAPITATHPYGDPKLEYFKCHAGDLPISFGTFARSRYTERDAHDIPFSQLVVDYWTSFARNLDPNPHVDYLRARGYWDTLAAIGTSGPWQALDATKPELMLLQPQSSMTQFPDEAQCAVLGQPFDSLLA